MGVNSTSTITFMHNSWDLTAMLGSGMKGCRGCIFTNSFKSNLQSNLAMLGFKNKLSHDYINQLPVSESSTHHLQNQGFFPLTSRPWKYGHTGAKSQTFLLAHKWAGPTRPQITFLHLCQKTVWWYPFSGIALSVSSTFTNIREALHTQKTKHHIQNLSMCFFLFVLFCFSVGGLLQIVT